MPSASRRSSSTLPLAPVLTASISSGRETGVLQGQAHGALHGPGGALPAAWDRSAAPWPRTSASTGAPRPAAASASSSTRIAAPSPSAMPSRRASKGTGRSAPASRPARWKAR